VHNKWHLITTVTKSLNGRVVPQVLYFSREREFSAEEKKKATKKSNPSPLTVVPTIIYKISNIIHQHFINFIFIVNSCCIIVVVTCRQVNKIYFKYGIILYYTRRRYPRATSKACAAVYERRGPLRIVVILSYHLKY